MRMFWILLFSVALSVGVYCLTNGQVLVGFILLFSAACKARDAFGGKK